MLCGWGFHSLPGGLVSERVGVVSERMWLVVMGCLCAHTCIVTISMVRMSTSRQGDGGLMEWSGWK